MAVVAPMPSASDPDGDQRKQRTAPEQPCAIAHILDDGLQGRKRPLLPHLFLHPHRVAEARALAVAHGQVEGDLIFEVALQLPAAPDRAQAQAQGCCKVRALQASITRATAPLRRAQLPDSTASCRSPAALRR